KGLPRSEGCGCPKRAAAQGSALEPAAPLTAVDPDWSRCVIESPTPPGNCQPVDEARRAAIGENPPMNKTFVVGVGMTKFDKPGTKEGDYPDWAKEAGEKALKDAGIPYDAVEQAYAGYVYGDSTSGQRAV